MIFFYFIILVNFILIFSDPKIQIENFINIDNSFFNFIKQLICCFMLVVIK